MIAIESSRARYLLFLAAMVSVNVIDGYAIRSIADPARHATVAFAASLDVVLVVSAVYYWLLVRPGLRAPGSVAFIAFTGALHATYFYPQGALAREILLGAGEFGLAALVIARVRRMGNGDPADAIRNAIPAAIPAARLIAGELTVLYYALFSWRARPHVALGAEPFTIHKRVGQAFLFAAFPFVAALEIVPVHVILGRWSSLAAWIATGVSVYGIVWLTGLARAFSLRPALIGADFVEVRYGLMFRLRIPRDVIASVRRAGPSDKPWAVPRKSTPAICIEFTRELEAETLLGMRRRMRAVAFTPDDDHKSLLASLLSPYTQPYNSQHESNG